MNRFCERCERITVDGNLWCQDPDCPAEEGYELLGYGDFLGDLKITKLVRVWRSAAVYEAERGKLQVLLKVAHPTDDCVERLKREAAALHSLSPAQSGPLAFVRSFLPSSRPAIPVILPPYPSKLKRPFGEITFRGEPRVYSVYQYARGKVLSDVLLENPQIWHSQAAWVITAVAEALRPLVAGNRCHLCLTPDIILVDTDRHGNLRPMLLDLGLILEAGSNGAAPDRSKLSEPAYTAPELLANSHDEIPTLAADVYSLGIIYFEMLAGRPGFESKLRRDDQLREDVTENRKPLSIDRPELDQSGVTAIVERALASTGRYNNVIELAAALTKIYSNPPAERRPVPRRLYFLLALVGTFLLIAAVFAAATLLQVIAR